MLIGIDGNEANVETKVGVHKYAFELLWALGKQQKKNKKHKIVVYLKRDPRGDMPKKTANFTYKVIPGGSVWILTKLMPYLFYSKEKPDVIFSPSHYVVPFAPMPRVCSIMDLGYLEFSGQFKKYDFWQLKYWTAISIYVSKCIIAISNSTKKDIVRLFPKVQKKIVVTHLAHDKSKFNSNISTSLIKIVKKKYNLDKYVLFLSTLKPSKNVEGLLEAWSTISHKFPKYKLVIAGKKGWLYKTIFMKVKDFGLENSVLFTGYLPEEEKPALIKGAQVFVMPSFWEGFGLDPLYAMAVGTPVAVSEKGSLPEVVGSAGEIFDPYNAREIADSITKILKMDKKRRNIMIKKGIIRSKTFSWEKTAKETLRVLESAQKNYV